jgi:hypothetical protein
MEMYNWLNTIDIFLILSFLKLVGNEYFQLLFI